MIKREQANDLYSDNWCYEFTTMEALSERIRTLACNGAYSLQVESDSSRVIYEVRDELVSAGFDVEFYNANQNILDVSWG